MAPRHRCLPPERQPRLGDETNRLWSAVGYRVLGPEIWKAFSPGACDISEKRTRCPRISAATVPSEREGPPH
jgi:hypothetical protein